MGPPFIGVDADGRHEPSKCVSVASLSHKRGCIFDTITDVTIDHSSIDQFSLLFLLLILQVVLFAHSRFAWLRSIVHTAQFMMQVNWSNANDTDFWWPLAYTMSSSRDDVRKNTSRNWTPFIRSIQGKDFMFKSDQGTNVMVYRQDGLLWQPCNYLSCRRCDHYPMWPWTSGAPSTNGFFFWTDSNGDSEMAPSEFRVLPNIPPNDLRASSTWFGEGGSITFRTGDLCVFAMPLPLCKIIIAHHQVIVLRRS